MSRTGNFAPGCGLQHGYAIRFSGARLRGGLTDADGFRYGSQPSDWVGSQRELATPQTLAPESNIPSTRAFGPASRSCKPIIPDCLLLTLSNKPHANDFQIVSRGKAKRANPQLPTPSSYEPSPRQSTSQHPSCTHRNTHSIRAHSPSIRESCVIRNAVTPSNRQHASKRKETARASKIGAPVRPSHLPSRPAARPCETRAIPVFTGRRRGGCVGSWEQGVADRASASVDLRVAFVCVFALFLLRLCSLEREAGGELLDLAGRSWLDCRCRAIGRIDYHELSGAATTCHSPTLIVRCTNGRVVRSANTEVRKWVIAAPELCLFVVGRLPFTILSLFYF